MKKNNKKPWPTKDAMEQIYAQHLWGTNNTLFYSGEGSHNPELVNPYVSVVANFLSSFPIPLTVCDLGCGDFNVGRQLVSYTKKYDAIDIVPSLIACNKSTFAIDNLYFHCLDIAKDCLPDGDCAIVRQVFQHLSNEEVKMALENLKGFKYVIVTEHIPAGDFVPNLDIISGQGIRLKKNSGINLLAAPFCLSVSEQKELLRISLNNNRGQIVTMLYVL